MYLPWKVELSDIANIVHRIDAGNMTPTIVCGICTAPSCATKECLV